MSQVISRVNGLKIAIPADARNVVHRFAIAGGGNELIFEPQTRKAFNQSKGAESQPLGLGTGGSADEGDEVVTSAVEITENVIEDEPEPAAKPNTKPTRKPRKAAPKSEPAPVESTDKSGPAEDDIL